MTAPCTESAEEPRFGAEQAQHWRHEQRPLPNRQCVARVKKPSAEASTLAMNDTRFPSIRKMLIRLGLAAPLLVVLAFVVQIIAG